MRRQTLVLIAVFISLAAASYRAIQKEPQRGMMRLRLSGVDTAAVDRIVLSASPEVTLVRKPSKADADVWMLPNGHHADATLVNALLGEVRNINTSDMISQDTGRFVDLNVEGDKATEVRLEKRGKAIAKLHVGEASAPYTFYVRDGDTVYRAQGGLSHMVRRGEGDWEDRRMFEHNVEDINAITIEAKGQQPLALAYAADGPADADKTWGPANAADMPKNMRFDAVQVSALARSIGDLRAERLLDDNPGDAVTRFADGDVVTWTLVGEPNSRHTLHLGAKVADKEGERYAKLEGQTQLFSINENTANAMLKTWNDLRAMTIMASTDFNAVKSVTMRLPKSKMPVVFNKAADSTFTVANAKAVPKGFIPDNVKVRQRAQQALFARAIRFEGPQKPQHGIGTSTTGAISYTLEDGSQASLTFGRAIPAQEGLGYYARGSASPDVYVISKALHDSLTDGIESLAKKAPQNAAGMPMAAPGANGLTPEMEAQIRAQLAASQAG